jgi:diguanylate cyclase (GGDEF)-like protein
MMSIFGKGLRSTFSSSYAKKQYGLSDEDLSSISLTLYENERDRSVFGCIVFLCLGLFYLIYDLTTGIYSGGLDSINRLGLAGVCFYIIPSLIYLVLRFTKVLKKKNGIRFATDFLFLGIFTGAMFLYYKDFLCYEGAQISDFSFTTIVFFLYCFIPLVDPLDWLIMTFLQIGVPPYLKWLAGSSLAFGHIYQTSIVVMVFVLGSLTRRTLNFIQEETNFENERANKRLASMMEKDELTGALNRYAMRKDSTFFSKTDSGVVFFFMLDIDNFKLYNDSFSHLKGDQCLKLIVSSLTNVLSGAGLKLYRYGGEEFLSYGKLANENEALSLGLALKDAVLALKIDTPKGSKIPYVTISIGISSLTSASFSLKDGIEMADKALYLSKNRGRNLCSYADKSYVNEESKSHPIV